MIHISTTLSTCELWNVPSPIPSLLEDHSTDRNFLCFDWRSQEHMNFLYMNRVPYHWFSSSGWFYLLSIIIDFHFIFKIQNLSSEREPVVRNCAIHVVCDRQLIMLPHSRMPVDGHLPIADPTARCISGLKVPTIIITSKDRENRLLVTDEPLELGK